MKIKYLFIMLSLVILSGSVLAEEINDSTNSSETIVNETNIINTTEEEPIIDYSVISIVPDEFKIGDIQFNIQVENIGNVELKNLMAIVSGKGFSTYNMVPIDSLKPGEKSYIIVMGNVKESGNITLTIKINDKKFNSLITVIDPNAGNNLKNLEELQKAEEKAKKELENFSSQLSNLTAEYKTLETNLENKTINDYDVSDIKLDDLKNFLRNTQSYIIQKDIEKAKSSLTLAQDEYDDLLGKLNRAKPIKKSFSTTIKENAILISTILASLVALFTLFEILKKKKDHLYERIKEMKVSKDSRVVLETKKKSKKSKNEDSEEKKE